LTDSDFAAGVMSQRQQSRGTLKGLGTTLCKVDYVPFEDKVEPGDWFYTSGDDRIFPRGFAVGIVKSVKPGQPFKEILLEPSGLQHGVEDVLIILSGAHQELPDSPPTGQPVFISTPPPAAPGGPAPVPQTTGTEADKLRSIYKSVGDAQGHSFGEGPPGSKPPDFTKLPSSPLPPPPPKQGVTAPAVPNATPKAQPPPGGRNPGTAVVPAPLPKAQNPDPARRGNQTAGAPGGPPHE
jgi:rod shape-determining protein MreC